MTIVTSILSSVEQFMSVTESSDFSEESVELSDSESETVSSDEESYNRKKNTISLPIDKAYLSNELDCSDDSDFDILSEDGESCTSHETVQTNTATVDTETHSETISDENANLENVNNELKLEEESPSCEMPSTPISAEVEGSPCPSEMDTTTPVEKRVTLIPRRTMSALSPSPALADETMARNLRAARWLDFTNEDDDDGLHQASESADQVSESADQVPDSAGQESDFLKPIMASPEGNYSGGIGKVRVRRNASFTLGAVTGLTLGKDLISRRNSSSIKRPYPASLPCQEIQFLDISYQNVAINSVQFSPIPRKKIVYHPVPYHSIRYCDVPYNDEPPVKKKPLPP